MLFVQFVKYFVSGDHLSCNFEDGTFCKWYSSDSGWDLSPGRAVLEGPSNDHTYDANGLGQSSHCLCLDYHIYARIYLKKSSKFVDESTHLD